MTRESDPSWQRIHCPGAGGPITFEDAARVRYNVTFDDEPDAIRFLELTELWPALSAAELLVGIEQREGQSALWKALSRVVPPIGASPSSAGPSVSGVQVDEFLRSFEWQRVRMRVIERDGAKCKCCGRTPEDGIVINVDHIKPRKRFPELALDESNLQVLCNECNRGKGNVFQTDWRSRS